MKRFWRKIKPPLLRVATISVTVWLIGCVSLCVMQEQMIYPGHAMELLSVPPPPFVEVLTLPVDDGQVEAWYAPAIGAPGRAPGAAPLVVYLHGNAELMDYQSEVIHRYRAMGFNVLVPEFRGFGRSAGKPSQEAIGEDMAAFYDMVIDRPQVDAQRVLFHGRSLGGAIAVDLATRRKPDAVILDATFTSMARMAAQYLAPPFIVRHPYRNDRVLPKLGVPTLISHGTNDEIISVKHGRKLAKITPDAVYYEYDCSHNDFPGASDVNLYWRRVAEFVSPMLQKAPAPAASPTH